MAKIEKEPIKYFEVHANSQRFDDKPEHMELLLKYFNGLNFEEFNGLTLSGNSYGVQACNWIAANVLAPWEKLREVNISNIFVGRLKDEIPPSMKAMMDALLDKKIIRLDMSHNAFGPQVIEKFEEFLSKASYLRHLDISNCGLSPKGGEMIAEALLKND